MDLYPENRISNFKVNLSSSINLDPAKWEVGLSEIQFTHTWYNIREGKNMIKKISHINKLVYTYSEISISKGFYKSIEDVISKLEEQEKDISYIYTSLDRKTKITIPESCKLDMNGSDIARCLGFNPSNQTSLSWGQKKSMISQSMSNVNHLYESIYVYCDIIKNQNVGDVSVPLLRNVPVTSKYGDVCCVKYDKPHYMPLSRSNIQTIEINLKDDIGEFISFEAGKVIVTLVFRRKSAKFYD